MSEHLCPVWVGALLANPLRTLIENPRRILSPYLKEGFTVLDAGSAMGFFSLPAASMVGPTGKVVCVDCQEGMLNGLKKRAKRAGLTDRLDIRACSTESLMLEDLAGQVDIALAIAMVHEAARPRQLLAEIAATLKPDGMLLVAEPKGHVSTSQIDETLEVTSELGFQVLEKPKLLRAFSFLMQKSPIPAT